MQKQYPSVYALSVHLENEQNIYFHDDDEIEQTVNRSKNTTLTEWFLMNKYHPETKYLKYSDFSDKYVWNKETKKWTSRKKDTAISRMVFVSPSEGERYYLRLLLTHVPGAKSYKDLRMVNNILHSSFKDACIAYGLLGDDKEFNLCLKEASEIKTGNEIRHLFALILSSCEVTFPLKLWEENCESLCEDILYNKQKETNNPHYPLNDYIKNKALQDIENILKSNNKSLKMFPEFNFFNEDNIDSNNEEFIYNTVIEKNKFEKNFISLTQEQKYAFEAINNDVKTNNFESKLFFIDGFGGSGKTYFYNTVLPALRSEGYIAMALASSGIASLLLDGGRTAHFRLKIPMKCTEETTCDIKQNSKLANLIQNTKLFIWDEAPM